MTGTIYTATRTPLDLTTVINNVGGPTGAAWGNPSNRRRFGNVSFEYQQTPNNRGFYWVRAWGDLFPSNGPEYKGKLEQSEFSVFNAITRCRNVWNKAVVGRMVPGTGIRRNRFPFSEWDLASQDDMSHLEDVGRELARAGNTLFNFLFRQRDDELRQIADLL
jgi:hypothetical protein